MSRSIFYSRSILRLSAFVVAPVVLFAAFGSAQDTKRPAGDKSPKAGKEYKNVKVLKDLPADQLIPVMRKMGASLGVKCDFCHVVNPDQTGYELDAKKHKVVARQMIQMTMDLNKKYKLLEGNVTCFMCHQGKEHPVRFPESNPEATGTVGDRP